MRKLERIKTLAESLPADPWKDDILWLVHNLEATADERVEALETEVEQLTAERDRWKHRWAGTVEDAQQVRDENARLARVVAQVKEALSDVPNECVVQPDDQPITCGWKRTVQDIRAAIEENPQ